MEYINYKDELKNIFDNIKVTDEADFFELDEYLSKASTTTKEQAFKIIPKHLVLLEQATTTILLLSKWITVGVGNNQRNALAAQLHCSSNLLISIRALLLSGLEEVARTLSRSYLEALDISVAIFISTDFAEHFFNQDKDTDKLWKNEIGYGKINNYLREAYERLDIPNSEIEDHINKRKAQKKLLSGTVHCDASSALRNWAIQPLGYLDHVSLNPHGILSNHTPNHMVFLINETYEFIGLFLKSLFTGNYNHIHNFQQETIERSTFIRHFFAFQDFLTNNSFDDGYHIVIDTEI